LIFLDLDEPRASTWISSVRQQSLSATVSSETLHADTSSFVDQKQQQELVKNDQYQAMKDLHNYFNEQNLDVFVRVIRSTLEKLRKRMTLTSTYAGTKPNTNLVRSIMCHCLTSTTSIEHVRIQSLRGTLDTRCCYSTVFRRCTNMFESSRTNNHRHWQEHTAMATDDIASSLLYSIWRIRVATTILSRLTIPMNNKTNRTTIHKRTVPIDHEPARSFK
jgi:hypothetical protein